MINIGGGGKKHLLKYIQPTEYLELDLYGNPDVKADLDNDYPLPIEDNRCDTVLCTDVLEHLEEFHRVFRELLRISNRYVIISVPNALIAMRGYLRRRKYVGAAGEAGIDVGTFTKFYGLPAKKPEDRHRWFFSYTEAEDFFRSQAKVMGYRIIEEYPAGAESSSVRGTLARLFVKSVFGEDRLKDLFFDVYWCVLEKESSH